jgi:ubiquinone/menaquinone biosynthesis C-methylase UbiE
MDENRQQWEQWAGKWQRQADAPENRYTRLIVAVFEMLRKHVGGGAALDVGCGPGLMCEMLADRGLDVYGMDIAENMVRAAVDRLRGKVDDPERRIRHSPWGRIPFADAQFDLVTCLQVFPYVPRYRPYIRRLSRVLKPGGLAVASCTRRCSLFVMQQVCDRLFRLPPHVRTIRNLLRTGYHSGGHVDYATARQVYAASQFDALFGCEGFKRVDSMKWFHFRSLDADPLRRRGFNRRLADWLAWYHIGVYRKLHRGEDLAPASGRRLRRPEASRA